MDAYPGLKVLILAGGRASRLGGIEKHLLKLGRKFLIDHVLDPISKILPRSKIWGLVSPRNPLTSRHLIQRRIQIMLTPGNGYIEDYRFGASRLSGDRFLICPGDLVGLTSDLIRDFISTSNRKPMGLGIEPEILRPYLDSSANGIDLVPTGIYLIPARSIFRDHLDLEWYPASIPILDIDTWRDYRIALNFVQNLRRNFRGR